MQHAKSLFKYVHLNHVCNQAVFKIAHALKYSLSTIWDPYQVISFLYELNGSMWLGSEHNYYKPSSENHKYQNELNEWILANSY